jgi:hypothetical protein|tara:strand:+ start:6518 stop:6859 length:342 start_codon:yes stop_codon:yes gene_type:complete
MTEQPKVREYDKVKYSDKDMWYASSKTAIAVFVIALIYARFLSVETTQVTVTEQQVAITEQMVTALKLLHDNDKINIDFLNDRIDKKTARIEADVIALWKEIDDLRLPNSDNE